VTRFRLTVEYDGRDYIGWQRQAHGASIQGAIEEALTSITGEPAAVYSAGRTDAGVHALAMPAHVDVVRAIAPARLMAGINARLRPQPIAIIAAEVAPPDWHARFDCVARLYRYRIVNRRAPLALDAGRAWRVSRPLDADAMAEAAKTLIGQYDFTTFRSAHCQAENPVRTLDRLDVRREVETIFIEAEARSFLHHQVRSMVGCLQLVGLGAWTRADLAGALEAKDRSRLGFNAPAAGLFFVAGRYKG